MSSNAMSRPLPVTIHHSPDQCTQRPRPRQPHPLRTEYCARPKEEYKSDPRASIVYLSLTDPHLVHAWLLSLWPHLASPPPPPPPHLETHVRSNSVPHGMGIVFPLLTGASIDWICWGDNTPRSISHNTSPDSTHQLVG